MEAVRHAQARLRLGLLPPAALIDLACAALEGGLDTPSLRVLAGEAEQTEAATHPLFEAVLRELGIEAIDEARAREVLARAWAAKIVEGSVAPYEGAKAIWDECCRDTASHRERVGDFRSLASEHEDYRFAEQDGVADYAEQIARCEGEIVALARMFVDAR